MKEYIKKIFSWPDRQIKPLKTALLILLISITILLIFQAGKIVGFKKANFSYQWGENYYKNFAGPRNGQMKGFMEKDFMGAHGVFGTIIEIKNSSLVIKGQDNLEKIVLLKGDTVINRLQKTVKLSDLKLDDKVVIIGSPDNEGQIEARLIRILPKDFPPMPSASSSPRNPDDFPSR